MTEDRLEVVEGLITALNNLQAVIAMIQEANDAASARASPVSYTHLRAHET